MAITFEQFQGTRKNADAATIEAAGYTVDDHSTPNLRGYMYLDALVIEDTASWPEAIRSKEWVKASYLLLGNCEFFSDDLEELERMLYQYAVDEDFTGVN